MCSSRTSWASSSCSSRKWTWYCSRRCKRMEVVCISRPCPEMITSSCSSRCWYIFLLSFGSYLSKIELESSVVTCLWYWFLSILPVVPAVPENELDTVPEGVKLWSWLGISSIVKVWVFSLPLEFTEYESPSAKTNISLICCQVPPNNVPGSVSFELQ